MSAMTDEDSESPRRRQASAEALAGRQAAMLVRELNRRLGAWQATSVKLHAMAQRLKAAGRHDPAVADEAMALLLLVRCEARRFEAMLPDLPPAVSQHGRIKDTSRSFEMITDRLRAALTYLGVEPDRYEGRVDEVTRR